MKKTLYDLKGEYLELQEMMLDDEADIQAISDTMEAIGGEIDEKADAYGRIIQNLEVRAKELEGIMQGFQSEADRLKAQVTANRNNQKRLKENLLSTMQAIGKKKIEGDLFKWTECRNSTPSLVIDDPLAIPLDMYKEPEPDTKKMASFLKMQEDHKDDWGHLEYGTHVRMR